jgi:hypothetical protein
VNDGAYEVRASEVRIPRIVITQIATS